jgi:TolB protein
MNHRTMVSTGARSLLFLTLTAALLRAQPAIDISREVDIDRFSRPIPVALSGFTGEADTVLRFDLFVMGFEFVAPDRAQYLISGSSQGVVKGRLTDAVSKAALLAREYTGGTLRSQAHAFADEIAEKITGLKGIARTKIAFKAETKPGVLEMFVADFDGFNAVAVTRDNSSVAAPAWVPGRRMLYYTSYRKGNPDIYRHDLATGELRAVAAYSGLNTSAAVSPDGRRIAMILSKSGSPDVWVADADGGNPRRLTDTPEEESSPCWSPDGRTLCFASKATGRNALYTVAVDSATPAMRRLRTDGVSNATEPDWSPDGRTIVFTSQMGGPNPFNICVVPAAGGEARVLVSGEDPSWAPNSRTVIFTRRSGDAMVLSLLDVPTKRYKDVPHKLGRSSQPAWAR